MKKNLTVRCLDDRRVLEFSGITALTASDASGQFGVLPAHAPLHTLLLPGLVVCKSAEKHTYLATAGGPFICRNGIVNIISTRFVQADTPDALIPALKAMKAEEGSDLQGRQQHTVDMTRTLLKRLKEWQELK